MGENELIRTEHLKKYFKTSGGMLHAVDDVNLVMRRGQTLGVVGESGCGKSTLGRVVLNLLEPTAGKVFFEGRDVTGLKRKEMAGFRRDAQIIFQDPYASLNPRLTVSAIIAEPMIVNKMASGKELTERVAHLMETVGLSRRLVNTYPHELDGGRRQRIGIARALAVNPKFIVCDEPVSALDVSIQAQILNLMMDLQEDRGLTYMFITHDLSVVRHISDDIAVMYLGVCVERGPAKELFRNPLHPYTKALLAAIPVPSLEKRGKPREILQGEISSPIDPKPGCRFCKRCKYAAPECEGQDWPLKEQTKDHFVACRLFA